MVSSNRLEPGTVEHIRVTVDTAGRSGHLTKYVSLYTNDRISPVRTLSVSLFVVHQAP